MFWFIINLRQIITTTYYIGLIVCKKKILSKQSILFMNYYQ